MASERAARAAPGVRPRVLWALNILAVIVLVILDWLTAAGVVVGILLSIPILLTSTANDPRVIWITTVVATIGFLVAAAFGSGPLAPPEVWVPNRILAFATLPASCAIALMLRRKRVDASRARDAALAASDMNQLLMSLLAHDVRSPLAMAVQALQYVEGAGASPQSVDASLLRDIQARLRRNLASLDTVLGFARDQLADPSSASPGDSLSPMDVAAELLTELRAFEPEARMRSKRLVPEFSAVEGRVYTVDARVLKQALAIILDNAVRYSAPGAITVSAAPDAEALTIVVQDEGPASVQPADTGRSGLGLVLCEALVSRAGGRLDRSTVGRNRTTFAIRLPAGPDAAFSEAGHDDV